MTLYKCIKWDGRFFTKGKVYPGKDWILTDNNGDIRSVIGQDHHFRQIGFSTYYNQIKP